MGHQPENHSIQIFLLWYFRILQIDLVEIHKYVQTKSIYFFLEIFLYTTYITLNSLENYVLIAALLLESIDLNRVGLHGWRGIKGPM